MTFLKQNWIKICIILLFIVIIVNQLDQNFTLKQELLSLKTIPHIELSNIQFKSSSGDFDSFYISGFVAFDNIDDQPRDIRQYYIIEPLFKRDINSKQIFSLREIISLSAIPPKEFDIIELKEKSSTSTSLVLEDEVGNIFTINRITKKVSMQDITGDKTFLITSQLDYRDFIVNLLK